MRQGSPAIRPTTCASATCPDEPGPRRVPLRIPPYPARGAHSQRSRAGRHRRDHRGPLRRRRNRRRRRAVAPHRECSRSGGREVWRGAHPRALRHRELTSIPDDEPKVQLEGAPRTEKLLDPRDIEITYEASDDHGLREVHLVLRSGDREERRVLARLDGETRHDRGGHRLWASDRFFKRAFAPIEITVEARDNDPLRGPKWGKSAPITLIPPLVGEPEALRYGALARARDAFVDLLAFRIENEGDLKGGAGPLRAHGLRETNELNSAIEILERGLDESYGGLRVARRIRTLAEGQLRKLREGLGREVAQTNSRTHGANRKLTEDFTLTLDSLLRRLDVTDATSIAKRLAEIADDAAEAAAGAKRPSRESVPSGASTSMSEF